MKNIGFAIVALLFAATAAHAEDAYPAYTKDKSAWWVSAIFVAPVVGFDVVGRAVEVTGKDQGAFQPLHSAAGGMIAHTATPVCGVPAVGMLCK